MSTPFALLAQSPQAPADRTPAFTYDNRRQLNITTTTGVPVVDVALADKQSAMLFGPSMTHNSSGLKKDDD